MSSKQKKSIQEFFFSLALVIALIVCIFSYYGGYSFLLVLVRTGVSFLLVYLLGEILDRVWKKVSPPPPSSTDKYRSTINVLLNEKSALNDSGQYDKDIAKYPGQITTDIKDGLPDPGKQAEIVRRMGWGNKQEVED